MTEKPEDNHIEEDDVFVFPASFAQQRLWFLDQLIPGTSLYNVPIVFRLTGALNLAALKQSFAEIVGRHEALRTTFNLLEGNLVQVITPTLAIALPLADLQELPAATREETASQQIWQTIEQPFDLSNGPLIRLLLLQLDESEYILLINLHHIVFDEWSSGILIRELGLCYTAYIEEKPVSLPSLPIQYADFACWQREWLQGEVLQTQLSYWRQQLKDIATLNLPLDHPRRPGQSYQGNIQLLELPQPLLEALEALSQQQGITLFMTLLAAFQTLLYRYTGQTDITIGSPIANRNRRELEDLIGFFVNSLVLRSDLSGNPTVRELLNRVHTVTLEAYAHQDLPFEKLVAELHPERDLSLNPLFQVVFALQNAPMEQLKLPGLTLTPVDFETKTARFDLELYLWKSSDNFRNLWGKGWKHSDGLRGVIVYNRDLFEPETITRLYQHFQVLLAGIVANPDAKLADLPLLTTAEQQMFVDWNQTQTNYPAHACINQLFEEQVNRAPNAPALQFGNQLFTYDALNKGSNQLAHYLRKRGVGANVLVGLGMEQSSHTIAGMLSILKAGGAYVPLDPTYPVERLRFMIEDAQVAVVLTHQKYVKCFTECNVVVICLDQEWETIAQESEANLSPVTAGNLAYVIYTSGSTGIPKGVAVPHRAVNRLVCNTNYIVIEPGDRIAQASNLAFDAATFEIWGALLNGAQLIGMDRDLLLSPLDFAAQIQQQKISALFLTTAVLNQIVREVPDTFRSLKYLLFGGEAVDPESIRMILKHGKPQHLIHVYGPTENTTFTSWCEIKDISEDATTIPIGKAVANTKIYLLDKFLSPVPIGIKGEIYIGGDGLANGYLNRSELTIERFIETSALKSFEKWIKPERLYRTGDLARYQADGTLEFLGRIDDQVKLRGFRIELGEIESMLNQHPAVQKSVVLLREARGDQRLVAYVVLKQAISEVQELRAFLRTKLPEYMLPSAYVILEDLPLTPNGKVDRRALPFIPIQTVTQANNISTEVVPQTSVEAELADIWIQLLGLQQIGVHDNFFELGGHSLLATQLVSRIRNRFQVEVPLRCLFEMPTITELAKYIETVCRTLSLTSNLDKNNLSDNGMEDLADNRIETELQKREEVEL